MDSRTLGNIIADSCELMLIRLEHKHNLRVSRMLAWLESQDRGIDSSWAVEYAEIFGLEALWLQLKYAPSP